MTELSAPSIHLSIRVQSGPHCLLSKIFFSPLCESFAGLFLRVSEQDSRVSEQHVLEKVIISDKSGNGGMEVDSGSPNYLCEEFNAKYVTFVCMVNPSACEVQPAQKNAFQVLMNATKPSACFYRDRAQAAYSHRAGAQSGAGLHEVLHVTWWNQLDTE